MDQFLLHEKAHLGQECRISGHRCPSLFRSTAKRPSSRMSLAVAVACHNPGAVQVPQGVEMSWREIVPRRPMALRLRERPPRMGCMAYRCGPEYLRGVNSAQRLPQANICTVVPRPNSYTSQVPLIQVPHAI